MLKEKLERPKQKLLGWNTHKKHSKKIQKPSSRPKIALFRFGETTKNV